MKITKAQFQHFFFYGVFGVLTTLINIVLFKLLIDLHINYIISTTISFIIAVSFAFLTNRKWVFHSTTNTAQEILSESIAFFLARIGTYLVDVVGLIVMIQLLNIDPFISKVVLNVAIIILNYVLSRSAVFKDCGYP